jgi:hypothetical protein
VTFNQGSNKTSTVLGSPLIANIDLTSVGFNSGWARIDFTSDSQGNASNNHQLTTGRPVANNVSSLPTTGNVFIGLPATGFSVVEYVNGNIGGALANYTGLYRHKFHRTCYGGAVGVACS